MQVEFDYTIDAGDLGSLKAMVSAWVTKGEQWSYSAEINRVELIQWGHVLNITKTVEHLNDELMAFAIAMYCATIDEVRKSYRHIEEKA
jgi:hypothetical protein